METFAELFGPSETDVKHKLQKDVFLNSGTSFWFILNLDISNT